MRATYESHTADLDLRNHIVEMEEESERGMKRVVVLLILQFRTDEVR